MARPINTKLLNDSLTKLFDAGTSLSRKDLDISYYYVKKLLASGHVAFDTNSRKSVKGRPVDKFILTANGRRKVRRLRKKALNESSD